MEDEKRMSNATKREKSLIIHLDPEKDMGDLLEIARVTGRKVLGVDRVRVKPFVAAYGNASYVVVVEPWDGAGCSRALDVERRK